MNASAAATKEIYLLVGTQGADKAKADLQDFDRTVKKTEASIKDNAKSAGSLGEAWERFGKIKEKVGKVVERFGFVLAAIPGFVGLIGSTIGGIIDTIKGFGESLHEAATHEKLIAELTAKANKELAEQKKHLQEIADLQFGSFTKIRGRIAGVAGVDPSSLSPAQLAASEELSRKQEQLDVTRNGLEREYVTLLQQRAAILQKGERVGNLIQAGGIFNQAKALGDRRKAVEANLRRLREEQIGIERDIRRVGGAGLNDKTEGAKGGETKEPELTDPVLKDIEAFLLRSRQTIAFHKEIHDEIAKQQKKAFDDSDKAVAALKKKQDDDFKASAELFKSQQEQIAKMREEAFNAGKEEGGKSGIFSMIGETDADRIRGMQDAIHEGITRPAQIAKEATDALGHGLADAAAAAILEGHSFKKAANEVLKAVTQKALAMAIFEGAAALASLALFDFRGAALHGQAAATYAAVAVVAGVGAAATGGFGSGRSSGGGSSSGGAGSVGAPKANTNTSGGSGGAVVYNFTVNYNGIRTSTRDHEDLIRILNSQAGRNGSAKIDRRLVA